MKPAMAREIKSIADEAGADSWELIRENKHIVIDFRFPSRIVRQVFSATPSDPKGRKNAAAWLRRKVMA